MKVFASLIPALAFLTSPGLAAVMVECHVLTEGDSRTLVIQPSNNPFEINSMEFENGFRFSAHVIGSPSKLKTFTYFASKDRHVLIQTDSRPIGSEDCGRTLGENRIYSPGLELELLNSCRVICGR